jgi:hypothetical protein
MYVTQTHVCVLQSTLDLLIHGYDVHVLADGVSSCNKEEIPFALTRMRQAGAQITTSESMLFQLMRKRLAANSTCRSRPPTGDSSESNFKAFSTVIKEEKAATTSALETLLPVKSAL